MRTVKTWLATIAVLLCSITANAKTSTYYDDWESGNKVEQGFSDGQIFSITANPGDMPTFDCSLNSESSYSSTSIVASGTCGTNLTWELTNEGELTIEGTGEMDNYETISQSPWYSYKSAIKSVIINEGVTTVGDYAFPICTNLINLSLPNTLKIIGKNAFDTCEKLTSLIIPEGCKTIEYGAFLYCSGLNTITLPNSLTSIGDYAFASCWNIESLFIPEKVEFIGELAFRATTKLNTIRVDSNNTAFDSRNDCNAIIETNTNKLRLGCSSTIIPNDIVIIGEGAFHSQNLSVTIPQSVKTVESWAFNGSSGQIKILCKTPPTIEHQNAFSSSTAEIHVPYGCLESYADEPWYTFRKNGKLKEFVPNIQTGTCGENLTYSLDLDYGELTISGTGEMMFSATKPWEEHIESIISVIIENGVTGIVSSAFRDCTGLTSITIPNSVTSIGSSAFRNCSGLTSITIPNSVTSIGNNAFYGCTSLTSITIPNSVTSIGYETFRGCSGLTSVTIGNSVESIQAYTFWKCSKLTSVTIPNSVKNIGIYAFADCFSLTSVTIGNSVESIGNYVFKDCFSLTSVTIGNSVESIGDYVFNGCSKLTSVTIGNSVESIGDYVFNGCSKLTSVTIGNSVGSIGEGAFDYCSGLTSVNISDIATWCNIDFEGGYSSNPLYYAQHLYLNGEEVKDLVIPNSVECIGDFAFYGCTGLTSVTIPNSVTSIGYGAFIACSGLTSVAIPNNVTSIGGYAFRSCSSLTSVAIPNSVSNIGEAAFSGCTGLTSVAIGNSVTSIGYSAFSNCTELIDVYCYAENVPSTENSTSTEYNIFGGSCPIANATLHVPVASLERYKSTSPWSSFANIVALPQEITLEDGVEYENNTDEDMSQITYTRTLSKTNTWNALYIPFEIPMTEEFLEDYDVAYFNDIHSFDNYIGDKENNVLGQDGVIDGMEMEVLKVHEGDVLNANYPYLIRAKNTDALNMNIVVEDATLYQAKETTISCSSVFMKFDVTGIYTTQTAGELKGEFDVYAMSGGGWKQALNPSQQLKPFRLYLSLSTIDGSPVKVSQSAMSRINIRVQGEDTETSILETESGEAEIDIFDLSGRRVQKTQKGLYIVNGKKVIVK